MIKACRFYDLTNIRKTKFTHLMVLGLFFGKVFSSDTVSGYKCSHFLVTMYSLLLGIFIKKTKMESFCTKTSPVRGDGMLTGFINR